MTAERDHCSPRYWTWDEIVHFLIANGLVIAEGLDDDDHVALTGKGEELVDVLAVIWHLGGGIPR